MPDEPLTRRFGSRDGKTLGNTEFCNMHAAYDDLPEALKTKLEGKTVLHDFNKFWDMMRREKASKRPPLTEAQRKAKPPVSHPIFLTHPLTGRKVLYANPGYSMRINELPEKESDEILAFLFEHQLQAKYRYANVWEEGDVLLWEDIGTIKSFFEANLDGAEELPKFNFFDMSSPIYTRPRFLPGSKVNGAGIDHAIISDGCIISHANISHSVIGIRSFVGLGTNLHRVIMMGADYYESQASMHENLNAGRPRMGIGQHCRIENTILDKNVRVGDNCVMSPAGKPENFDGNGYVIRDGIVIADGLAIESLRRFKDDVTEVKTDFECGIGLGKYNDIQLGDEDIALHPARHYAHFAPTAAAPETPYRVIAETLRIVCERMDLDPASHAEWNGYPSHHHQIVRQLAWRRIA